MKDFTRSRLFFLVLAGGAILRLLFLATPWMDSDMAINGLMARHILDGAFPVFFYGQPYCGSLEAFWAAPFFLLFGADRFTLNLSILVLSLFFLGAVILLARRVLDSQGAWLAALFTALPSYYLIHHSVLARSAYIEIPLLGTLLFILTLKATQGNRPSPAIFLALGLLSGAAAWTHFLSIFYLIPLGLFLFLKDRCFWCRKTMLFFLPGLLLGALPFLVYNWIHPLATWTYLQGHAAQEPFLATARGFLAGKVPEILGVMDNGTRAFFLPYFSALAYGCWLGVFLSVFFRRRKALGRLLIGDASRIEGIDLLLIFLCCFPVLYFNSGFSGARTARYLVPLFTALPILLGFSLQGLRDHGKSLFSLLLGCLLISNLYGILDHLFLIHPEKLRAYWETRETDQRLFRFLKARGINRAYVNDYWNGPRLTFDAREEVIFAQAYQDRYPGYTRLADASARVAYVFTGETINVGDTLRALGGEFRKEQIGPYGVYYHFRPPEYAYEEIDPADWRLEANYNPQLIANLTDRDMTSAWTSGRPQLPGMTLTVDLGRIYPLVSRLLLFTLEEFDTPRGLRLEGSIDNHSWEKIYDIPSYWRPFFWSAGRPFNLPDNGPVEMVFPPRPLRFLKLSQTGSDDHFTWTVHGLTVYQAYPGETGFPVSWDKIITTLESTLDRSVTPLRTTPGIKAHLPWAWESSREDRGSPNRGDPDLGWDSWIRPLRPPAFLVEKNQAKDLRLDIKRYFPVEYQEKAVEELVLFYPRPGGAVGRKLPPSGWRVRTNCNEKQAFKAIDRKLSTRWDSGAPPAAGDVF